MSDKIKDKSSFPYTVGDDFLNPFKDAEPYFYGSGSPNAGYFMPIGEDLDPLTNEFKVQLPEEYNKYSTINYIDQYSTGSNKINLSYIEKGTFPIISSKHHIKEWDYTNGTICVCANYKYDFHH